MPGKDFVSVADLNRPELLALLDRAAKLKSQLRSGQPHPLLTGKSVALVFQKPSLRTRVSFDVGVHQLGGRALYLSPAEIKLGEREDPVDAARVLSRMVDAIVARTYLHRDVETLALSASVPVINGLSDHEHPCQVLADLLTIQEHVGGFAGTRLAYVGDGNNVLHSLMLAAPVAGLDLSIATPADYRPEPGVVDQSTWLASEHGTEVTIQSDPHAAVRGVDIVYTDTWFSMGQEDEAEQRRAAFASYQVNDALLDSAGPRARVMHCLPAHRREEITDAVIDGDRSIVYDQAENRVHAQKALLVHLLGRDGRD